MRAAPLISECTHIHNMKQKEKYFVSLSKKYVICFHLCVCAVYLMALALALVFSTLSGNCFQTRFCSLTHFWFSYSFSDCVSLLYAVQLKFSMKMMNRLHSCKCYFVNFSTAANICRIISSVNLNSRADVRCYLPHFLASK